MSSGPQSVRPTLVREPGTTRQLLLQSGLVLAALVIPSTIALVERPDNRTEAVVAMILGVLTLLWLSYRTATAGFRIGHDGLTTLGLRPRHFASSTLDGLRFETWTVPHRDLRLHRLVLEVDCDPVHLTRQPMDEQARRALEQQLRAAGLRWSD